MPLSGPWARQGILERMGAEMAVDDINAAGGIKALGGAKLKLLVFDTGDTAEKAKDAAQRMLAQNPDLVGGIGCWLSTFTLAVTEVTERAQLPWLTLSYSDAITGRGFHYVFQTSPTADKQATDVVPIIMKLAQRTTGKRPTKVAIIGDNTAASVSFLKPIRDHILKDAGLTAWWTRSTRRRWQTRRHWCSRCAVRGRISCCCSPPTCRTTSCWPTLSLEYGMGGGKLPLIGNGGHWATPELLKTTGRRYPAGHHRRAGELAGQGAGRTRQAVRASAPASRGSGMTPSSLMRTCMILKQALEMAGAADRREGRRRDPQDGHDGRPGAVLPRASPEVRRQGPPRRCRAGASSNGRTAGR